MSNLNEEDIAEIMEEKQNEPPVLDRWIMLDLKEWDELIRELSDKGVKLYKAKNEYNTKSEKIISETDFKTLYGANNQKVRDNHVKTVLSDDYKAIKDLEFSIDYITRRISFLNELVKTKRTIMEVS